MPEPTLRDIETARVDPEIGTGQPAVVYDNTQLLNTLNQNAQLKQANDWRKYQQFLGDYETRLKNQQEIADKDIADSDRDYLKKQSVELFSTALDDPTKIYSPEFNNKLASIRSEAVSSKQARDFAEKNLQFIVTNPEFNTDENKTKIKDYLDSQTVEQGGRKTFTLDVPDVFDMNKFWGGVMEDPRVKTTENVNWIDPQKALRYDRTDTKYLLDPFLKAAESTYDMPQIKRRADKMYSELPDNVKSQFPTAKDFWVKVGAKYFGSDKDIVRTGKENVDNYNAPIERERMALDEKQSKRDNATRIAVASMKGDGNTTTEIEADQPFESIKESWGGSNKLQYLKNLPVDQIMALVPDALDDKLNIKKEYKKYQISVGTVDDEGQTREGILLYPKGWEQGQEPIFRNKELIDAQGRSYITASGKKGAGERKGQLVYPVKKSSPTNTSVKIDGNNLIFKGNKYSLKEVQDAGYKDFEDFKKNN